MSRALNLRECREHLRRALTGKKSKKGSYAVPRLWTAASEKSGRAIVPVDPSEFFLASLDRIGRVRRVPIGKGPGGSWTRDAVIYNMFVRTTCAFDHDRNGRLDLPVNKDGWRETGTFLKAIAMLPYVRSLGANTLHLLPITSIGADGNKGSLGSPYAIRNPYLLDDKLSEPRVGLGVEEEFRMFVLAAHHLGMRVVVEFVFRTAAKDGDWVKEHPDWFYWIGEDVADRLPGSADEMRYGPPIFTPEELQKILASVEKGDYRNLIPPHPGYRAMFTEPPLRDRVLTDDGRFIGIAPDGRRVRIPGAFADWPPDDSQPPWGDVTYLKLYRHPDFNYIAYNTLRMYDDRLAAPENAHQALWEKIEEIIPHYQKEFGIDGVMIDMGHALPMELKREMIRRARTIDPDFAFWDENFSVNRKSVEEGYNAVIGYQWSDQHHPERFRNLLRRFSTEGFPLPFFATAESHNTPRAAARPGGLVYSRYAWTIGNFIPAIPFIHSGMELGETYPINTGLDFTKDEQAGLPSEKLPLFSEYAYDWTDHSDLIRHIRLISRIRERFKSLIIDDRPGSFHWIEMGGGSVIAFVRHKPGVRSQLVVIANPDMHQPQKFCCPLGSAKRTVKDLISAKAFRVKKNVIEGTLSPGQVVVIAL